MKIEKISREAEAQIPPFESHKEAREWFIKKYGDSFMTDTSAIIGDGICYFYYLILDKEIFWEGMRELVRGGFAGAEFLKSHQSIQIMDDGSIHIVH